MRIDTGAYLGHWPFRKVVNNTAATLAPIALKNDITHMIVASINALFYKDTMEGNLELLEDVKSYNGPLEYIPFAVINPTYPEWENDMKKCINELGFKGVELAPAYHKYPLAGAEGVAAFKLAGELGVPVRVENEFENIRQHHWMDVTDAPSGDDFAVLLNACDKTPLFINGYFPTYLDDRFGDIVKNRKNVFVGTRRLDPFTLNAWENTLEFMDVSHLCLASLSPFSYIEPSLVSIQFAPNTDDEKEGILYKNVRSCLGL
ncbi:MAG: hypothetical protein RSA70_02970 [Clostridia bacterium]